MSLRTCGDKARSGPGPRLGGRHGRGPGVCATLLHAASTGAGLLDDVDIALVVHLIAYGAFAAIDRIEPALPLPALMVRP
ncbi:MULTISPECIES: hypothetical protein [unclassified Streptomyces]|uniref:hypothetical protein n=1 Tax=unclassified Streptomyces TaxID=2593676 RepID=UPI002DDA2DF2|nr:hypothetical protein [Streptomyces sp. NBC_01445]WSE04285.1 hypothetical protein OG574_13510 [Streptomyces sp. NBC_01445]